VPERIDNYSFVLPVKGQVKYHMKLECEALNRGFKNFFMPEVIVRLQQNEPDKHKNVVEEIRNWFSQNNYTIQRYENQEIKSLEITRNFNSYFPEKFDIEPIMISESDKLENNFQWYVSKKDGTKNFCLSLHFLNLNYMFHLLVY
jgi:hypothetical protein